VVSLASSETLVLLDS